MNTHNTQFPSVTLGQATLTFSVNTGMVDKVTKRVETHLRSSSSATHQSHTVNVRSSNTTVTELWMKDGDLELDHTLRRDISVKEGQKVSIISISSNKKNWYYVGILNYNTGTWQDISSVQTLAKSTDVMSSMPAIVWIVLIALSFGLAAMHPLFTAIALVGLAYWALQRSNNLKAYEKSLENHINQVKQSLISQSKSGLPPSSNTSLGNPPLPDFFTNQGN